MEWKAVCGYPNYEVSDTGLVRNRKSLRVLQQQVRNTGGYFSVSLYHNGRSKSHYVHRLVALAFVGGHFLFAQVNHKDLNKANNHASNLEWCTPQQNTDHKVANNAANGNRVYSDDTYTRIKSLRKDGYSERAIASLTGLSKTQVHNIVTDFI